MLLSIVIHGRFDDYNVDGHYRLTRCLDLNLAACANSKYCTQIEIIFVDFNPLSETVFEHYRNGNYGFDNLRIVEVYPRVGGNRFMTSQSTNIGVCLARGLYTLTLGYDVVFSYITLNTLAWNLEQKMDCADSLAGVIPRYRVPRVVFNANFYDCLDYIERATPHRVSFYRTKAVSTGGYGGFLAGTKTFMEMGGATEDIRGIFTSDNTWGNFLLGRCDFVDFGACGVYLGKIDTSYSSAATFGQRRRESSVIVEKLPALEMSRYLEKFQILERRIGRPRGRNELVSDRYKTVANTKSGPNLIIEKQFVGEMYLRSSRSSEIRVRELLNFLSLDWSTLNRRVAGHSKFIIASNPSILEVLALLSLNQTSPLLILIYTSDSSVNLSEGWYRFLRRIDSTRPSEIHLKCCEMLVSSVRYRGELIQVGPQRRELIVKSGGDLLRTNLDNIFAGHASTSYLLALWLVIKSVLLIFIRRVKC